MHKEGIPFVVICLGAAAACGIVGLFPVFLVPLFILLGSFSVFFFRDPERTIPMEPSLLVSPADGTVVKIGPINDESGTSFQRVSIFLSVFNVHINRIPVGGVITDIQYTKGKFLAAFNHLASEENERNCLWIQDGDRRYRVTQIAGLIARRIVCWRKPGDKVSKGERFGLIRFGSRVDLDFPLDFEILVKIGEKVQGGSTAIGRLRS
jgi:phosphatidylserine decarboxylase